MKNLQLQLSVRNSDIVGHIPDFLSEEEVNQVKKLNYNREWKMAGTKWSKGDLSVRYSKKLSQILFPFYDRLYDAVSLYNKKSYNLHLYPNRNQHEINWVRYDKKGMFFTAHRDHRPCLSNFLNKESVRKISCSIQLTHPSEYEGGDLKVAETFTHPDVYMDSSNPPKWIKHREKFRHNFNTIKKCGSITMFTSIHEHESTPLVSGARDVVVVFIRGESSGY